ncbi:tautomerase family protein [Leptospira interrogans]
MPVVSVDMLSGRTPEVRAELAEAITKAFVEIAKSNREQVTIIFNEVSPDYWVVGGETVTARQAKRNKAT